MEKRTHAQLELFSSGRNPVVSAPQSRHSFLSFVWNYEKAIVLIVGFIITATISFALGVERGKKIAAKKPQTRAFMAQAADSAANLSVSIVPVAASEPVLKSTLEPIKTEEAVAVPAIVDKIKPGSYTIQVASFKQESSAQKEIEVLKKKGFVASMLSKGSYLVVCVGNFMEKSQAKTIISELKKRYQDCFIRRL